MEEWPQRQAGFALAMGNGFHLLGLLCPHQLTPALPVIVPSVLGVYAPCSDGLGRAHAHCCPEALQWVRPMLKPQPMVATKGCASGNQEVPATGSLVS